jgi:hypothetical protein
VTPPPADPSLTDRARVFCIGLNKTGTISLHQALEHLGYRSLHWGGPPVRRLIEANAEAGRPLLDGVEEFDAYSDILALSERFELLDRQYPGSRFIVTTRPVDDWIASREAHVLRNRERAAQGTYAGDFLDIEPDRWRAEFAEHHRRIAAYFTGRDDLLEMRITEGDGYERLCPFLGVEVPDEPFPHRHRATPA